MCRYVVNWRLLGVFTKWEDVAKLVRQGTCSKRKTDELLTGTKITYRCNSWKKTRCPYQMYSLTTSDGQIFLYEGGQHDHTGVRIPNLPTMAPSVELDLQSMLKQALPNAASLIGPSTSNPAAVPIPGQPLEEGSFNIADLLMSPEKQGHLANMPKQEILNQNSLMMRALLPQPGGQLAFSPPEMKLVKRSDELQEIATTCGLGFHKSKDSFDIAFSKADLKKFLNIQESKDSIVVSVNEGEEQKYSVSHVIDDWDKICCTIRSLCAALLEPLEAKQIEGFLDLLAVVCSPDWVYTSSGPNVVTTQLAAAISNRSNWKEIVHNNTCDSFAYDALLDYVERARCLKPTHLGVVVDTGENITRAVLLKALSRCLGQFFIRCLLYTFRAFTFVRIEENGTCRYALDVESIRRLSNGRNSPGPSSSRRRSVSSRSSMENAALPCPQSSTASVLPSKADPASNRSSSLETEPIQTINTEQPVQNRAFGFFSSPTSSMPSFTSSLQSQPAPGAISTANLAPSLEPAPSSSAPTIVNRVDGVPPLISQKTPVVRPSRLDNPHPVCSFPPVGLPIDFSRPPPPFVAQTRPSPTYVPVATVPVPLIQIPLVPPPHLQLAPLLGRGLAGPNIVKMAPSRDILDILPSTSEEQVLRRINDLVPKKLFHPIPTFNETKLGLFVHFDKKKNISSVEGLRQMLGSTIYNHIGDHPLREHIQINLADYQNSFSLNRIAKKIEKILPQNYKSEPLRREQLEKVLEIMGELCIPDWAYTRNGPNAVTHELASAITVRKEWEAVVTGKNHYCYFVYDAMEKYVEKRATRNHRILDVVPDYGTNINRTIALRALSRCLGSFFIRCLVYAFRSFTTTVPLDENTCLYSIDMTRLRDCAKDGSNQGKSAGQCPAQQSTSNCVPSRPGAIPSRTSSLGGEQTPPPFTRATQRDRPSPQPGAVVNRQKAFSMDGPLPPPPPPPTGVPLRFPPSSAAPNFIPNSPTVSSPRLLQNRPGPNGLQYQSPVAGGLPPLFPSPPSGRGTVRKSPSNMDGEPPQKKKLDEAAIQRAGRQCEQAEHTTWLVEQNKAKTEEISRLNKTLQKKAGEQKDMKNQKEKADTQVKELMVKMAAMEEVQQRREATYQKQIQILEEKAQQDEEKAQQDKEKIQRLENVLSAAGNQADAEVIRGWEKKCNMLNKQLAQKTIEILSLGQQKEAILNDLKQLGLRYQDGPNRERQQLNKIEELKKTIEELTQNNQGGKKVEELERKIAELEYNNREQIDQYDSLEKQLQVKEKQMIQEMKATNEQRRQCKEEREEKEEMTQRLRERHRQAEKAEAELKKQIDDLTKELETTKQEKNAEKIDLDVALKQIEEEHERANQLERKEKELMARVQVLEKYLAAEKKKQTDFSEYSKRVTDELEKIRKERDELKTTSGKDKEKITRMERELEEKREDLKKTETVFEELHSFCAEREQKIEELTKDLEEVKKQQETKERKTAADHKKKLQETENNKKQELEAAATMLKAVEREAAALFQKCQAAEAGKMAELKKEEELKKMKDHLGEIKNKAEVERNALLKKQEGELAKLNSERLEEKAELRKKLEDFKDSVRERIKTLTEKIDPLERELKEEREKNAKEQEAKASLIEEVEKLRRDLQGKEEIFLTKVQKNFEDLKKNLCRMFPSPQ